MNGHKRGTVFSAGQRYRATGTAKLAEGGYDQYQNLYWARQTLMASSFWYSSGLARRLLTRSFDQPTFWPDDVSLRKAWMLQRHLACMATDRSPISIWRRWPRGVAAAWQRSTAACNGRSPAPC